MSYQPRRLAEAALALLDAEPHLTLAELTKRLGVCRQTLERAIRARTGNSFRQCRSQSVALKARRLLTADGAQMIKEVAYQLGYRSPQFMPFPRVREDDSGGGEGCASGQRYSRFRHVLARRICPG